MFLENENKNLNNKLISKENQLKQELTDKEILFIKLQNLEKENDILHDRVNYLSFLINFLLVFLKYFNKIKAIY